MIYYHICTNNIIENSIRYVLIIMKVCIIYDSKRYHEKLDNLTLINCYGVNCW